VTATGSWSGKVVLVTGAASGVGRGVALAAAAAGASVALAVRRPPTAVEVVERIDALGTGGESLGGRRRAVVVPCDLMQPGAARAAVATTVAQLGRLDAIVHSATSNASSQPVALEEADLAEWDEHRTIALDATIELARAAHAPLKASGGSLLLMTSPAGIAGNDRLPFYAMAKGAQRALVKSLAREWGPDGIRVNALAPLAMSPAMRSAFEAEPRLEQALVDSISLGFFGDAERDVAPAALFLCSDDARYVTGQTLVVNGGRYTSL
jgi:NAD(P)-dependent dehydrogenase (short-subunit alcohol dehydrogenase family)